jgi:predicted DNA-binding transcriptional regulator
MTSYQRVFTITDLIKIIGEYKHYFEKRDNIEYFIKLLKKLNKLHIEYVNKCWRPYILSNKITSKEKNQIKKSLNKILVEIEKIATTHLFPNEKLYKSEINQLYNIIFMDMNNLKEDLCDFVEKHPYIEMGPLFFMTYKYTPELNRKLNDYGLQFPIP